jgi:hypothetical protein
MQIKNKTGALELSIGTVVVIVIAMSMLILGLVLVRNIFSGANQSVDQINEGLKSEIIKMFQDESERGVVRLTQNTAKIQQGETFGIAFGIRNNEQGAAASKKFYYKTVLVNKGNCPSEDTVKKWIFFGEGDLDILPGQVEGKVVKFKIPEDAPLCNAEFKIIAWSPPTYTESNPYVNLQFFIETQSSGVF